MDKSWRHAALEGAVSEVQMQSINECMEEVALQMQMQMTKQQEDIDTSERDQLECRLSSFNDLHGVQNAEDDTYAVDLLNGHHDSSENVGAFANVGAVANDAFFQVLITALVQNFSPNSDHR